MRVIQICYDLKDASDERYTRLHNAITSLGKAEHVQYSVFIVHTPRTAAQVRDLLQLHLASEDSLLVTDINAFASNGAQERVTNLIKRAFTQPRLTINSPTPPRIPTRNQAFNPLRKKY